VSKCWKISINRWTPIRNRGSLRSQPGSH